MTTRQQALQWWNNLSSADKTRLCDLNTETLGIRRWESLTGREIERLFEASKDGVLIHLPVCVNCGATSKLMPTPMPQTLCESCFLSAAKVYFGGSKLAQTVKNQ